MLTLIEEVYILSINDARGVVHRSSAPLLPAALAAALLTELGLRGCLSLDRSGRLCIDQSSCGDDVLDEVAAQIRSSSKPRSTSYWIERIADHPKALESRLAAALQTIGVVSRSQRRITWVIPSPSRPEKKVSTKYWLKNDLREAILAGENPGLRRACLLSLLDASGLVDLVFTKDERSAARAAILKSRANLNQPAELIALLENILHALHAANQSP
jgi:hypothetical protein